MTRIAVLSDCDKAIVGALQSAGDVSLISDVTHVDASVHDTLVVDWRESSIDKARVVAPIGSRVPCIVVIDSNQVIPDSLSFCEVADVVSVDDIRSTAFIWRLEKMCQNHRIPSALAITQSPDNALFNSIIDHLSDWIIVKDLEHRFLLVSDDFAKTVGLPKEQIIGKNDLEIGTTETAVFGDSDTDWPGFWAQDDAVIEAGIPAHEENKDWRAFSLSRRYKRTTRVPLRNARGDIFALLVIAADITDRVQAEHHLQSRNMMLRRVTEEKFKAEQHRQIAEIAVSAKNKFLAAASHDLRQPLHALGLFLAVLERRTKEHSDLEILQKIRQSSDSLNALFNSLLDISRLDAGVVNVALETFSVSELLISIRDEFVELGDTKSLAVSVEITDSHVHSDRILLGRILRNLLQNAITYTDTGSVTVRCQKNNEQLTIAISDTGPGIPESQYDAIFSEYYQLNNNLNQSTKGLGLGLAIVRKMAQLSGIDIHLKSDLGEGSCFTVMVPLGIPVEVSDSEKPDTGQLLAGIRVLLIDDEPDIRQGLSLLLDGLQCHTVAAESAVQALKLLDVNRLKPDIMIVDYQLLNGDTGIEAIARIHTHFKRAIPAIIITGDTSNERLHEATKTGYRLLHKPVDVDELISTLAQVLEEHQLAVI